jgi:5,10-methenyltetrahydrofolate synthetase
MRLLPIRTKNDWQHTVDKKQLRQQLKKERLTMPERPARQRQLHNALLHWMGQRIETCVGAYWPIQGEFDPIPAFTQWLGGDRSRHMGLPCIEKNNKTFWFSEWYPGCAVQTDSLGIAQPIHTMKLQPTLLIVPCLGMACGGWRLGYGGGYYDRTLAALQPRPFTLGIGFSVGRLAAFTPGPHDIALDALMDENGVFDTRL